MFKEIEINHKNRRTVYRIRKFRIKLVNYLCNYVNNNSIFSCVSMNLLAEMNHFQQESVRDISDLMIHYLRFQVVYHKTVGIIVVENCLYCLYLN